MNITNRFTSKEDFLSFRDHLGKVMSDHLSLPLKPRKLDELAAKVVGAKDFNTAIAACSKANALIINSVHPGNDHEIAATIMSDNESMVADFDATPYFEFHLSKHNLVFKLMHLLEERSTGGCSISSEMCRFIAFENESVNRVLEYSVKESPDVPEDACYSTSIDMDSVVDWLLNQRLYMLASWVDAYEAGYSLDQYEQEHPSFCYHLDKNKDEDISSLMNAISDLSIYFDEDTEGFHWKIADQYSHRGFYSKNRCFANFLDAFTVDPKADKK